ncbi:hypothetical protein D3C71_1426720 [compost metagenome]
MRIVVKHHQAVFVLQFSQGFDRSIAPQAIAAVDHVTDPLILLAAVFNEIQIMIIAGDDFGFIGTGGFGSRQRHVGVLIENHQRPHTVA